MSKIAVVHDYLTQCGGAERVALAMAMAFPGAPIFTSMYVASRTFAEFGDLDVRVTSAQQLVPHNHFRWGGPIFGSMFRHLDLSEFDKVIVSSSGFAHHVNHPNAYIYCHTPPRFIYDIDNYFASHHLSRLTRPFIPWLTRNDRNAATKHNHYVANSLLTQKRIAAIYGKQVDVIHPPLTTTHLPLHTTALPAQPRALTFGRLQPYKRFDLAIEACAKANIPLTIAGTGPDERRLKSMAIGDVTFLGRVADAQAAQLFETHSVVLMPGIEDFGLASIEANYAGRPVIARHSGGAVETVKDNITGKLIESEDIGEWADAILTVLGTPWTPDQLRESTKPFQQAAFQQAVRHWMHEE